MINKGITVPKLPVKGVWGMAYLTKQGIFRVTAFKHDEALTEAEQPGNYYRAKGPQKVGYSLILLGVLIAALGGPWHWLFIPGGILVAVSGVGYMLYKLYKELTIPQYHYTVNTGTPTLIDSEVTELVRSLGHEGYDPVKHARLFEILEMKAKA